MKAAVPLTALALVAAFALGYGIGRHKGAPQLVAVKSTAAAADSTTADAAPAESEPERKSTEPLARSADGEIAHALVVLRGIGMYNYVALFVDGKVSPMMARALRLNATESNALFAAHQRVVTEVENARVSRASAHLSEDGKTLRVEVPALETSASAAIRDNYLREVEAVVGSERMQTLMQISREDFDTAAGRYGLTPLWYELTLEPTTVADGRTTYPMRKLEHDPTGDPTAMSGTSAPVSLAEIRKLEPVLARFLPPIVTAPPKP